MNESNGILLYGASGHAKVIADVIYSENFFLAGIFDDDLEKNEFRGIQVITPYNDTHLQKNPLLISIGDNLSRYNCSRKVKHQFKTLVHGSSIISSSVKLGEGTVILHGSVIQADTTIGKHAIINSSASIDHDCIIGDFSHIAPNTTICGGVNVGVGVMIGAGSVILPNIKIGKWAIIGGGAIITKNIPDFAVVVGNNQIIRYQNEGKI